MNNVRLLSRISYYYYEDVINLSEMLAMTLVKKNMKTLQHTFNLYINKTLVTYSKHRTDKLLNTEIAT